MRNLESSSLFPCAIVRLSHGSSQNNKLKMYGPLRQRRKLASCCPERKKWKTSTSLPSLPKLVNNNYPYFTGPFKEIGEPRLEGSIGHDFQAILTVSLLFFHVPSSSTTPATFISPPFVALCSLNQIVSSSSLSSSLHLSNDLRLSFLYLFRLRSSASSLRRPLSFYFTVFPISSAYSCPISVELISRGRELPQGEREREREKGEEGISRPRFISLLWSSTLPPVSPPPALPARRKSNLG